MNEEEYINNIIAKYQNIEGKTMPILQDIQNKYGYLSYDNMLLISEKLDISLEKLYSIATFYKQFNLTMRGKYQIGLCLGTVCYVKGSGELLDELENILQIKDGECTSDGKFSIDTTRCLGCCSMAPVIKINNDVYGNVKKSELKNILDKYQ